MFGWVVYGIGNTNNVVDKSLMPQFWSHLLLYIKTPMLGGSWPLLKTYGFGFKKINYNGSSPPTTWTLGPSSWKWNIPSSSFRNQT
jgi:hypothetical protein